MNQTIEEQLKYLTDRYYQYIVSTNPEKGEFDYQTHINLLTTYIKTVLKEVINTPEDFTGSHNPYAEMIQNYRIEQRLTAKKKFNIDLGE